MRQRDVGVPTSIGPGSKFLVRKADVADVGEVFADLACACNKCVPTSILHLKRRVGMLGNSAQYQHRAALVIRPKQVDEFQAGTGEVDPTNFDMLLQLGIEFDDPNEFCAARAVVRPSLIRKVRFDEIQFIVIHGHAFAWEQSPFSMLSAPFSSVSLEIMMGEVSMECSTPPVEEGLPQGPVEFAGASLQLARG